MHTETKEALAGRAKTGDCGALAALYEQKIRWLTRYREMIQDTQHTYSELLRWRSIAEKVTPTLTGLPHAASDGSRTEYAVEKMDALRLQLAEDISALLDQWSMAEQAINTIPDARQRLILKYRYIDGLSRERIAKKISCTPEWVSSQHRRAIEQMDTAVCQMPSRP